MHTCPERSAASPHAQHVPSAASPHAQPVCAPHNGLPHLPNPGHTAKLLPSHPSVGYALHLLLPPHARTLPIHPICTRAGNAALSSNPCSTPRSLRWARTPYTQLAASSSPRNVGQASFLHEALRACLVPPLFTLFYPPAFLLPVLPPLLQLPAL